MSPRHEKPDNDNPLERLMVRWGLLKVQDVTELAPRSDTEYRPKHLSDEQYSALGRPPIEMQRLNDLDGKK